MKSIEEKIKYTFLNKNLLKEAMTHSSTEERSYERLEFLGDAVLELIVSKQLFLLKEMDEGVMSKKRAMIVKEESLAETARKLGLNRHLIFGKSEIITKGKNKPSILADAFEALLGAVYLDGGYDAAERIALENLEKKIREVTLSEDVTDDYKSGLNEMLMKSGVKDAEYELYRQTGPQHDKVFYVRLKVNGEIIGMGKGKTKKAAEQQAAKKAFINLKGEKQDVKL